MFFLHLKFLQLRPVSYPDRYRIVGNKAGRNLNFFPEIASNWKMCNPMRSFIRGPFHIPVSIFFLLACCSVLSFLRFPHILSREFSLRFPQSKHRAFYISTIKCRVFPGCGQAAFRIPVCVRTSVNFGKFCFCRLIDHGHCLDPGRFFHRDSHRKRLCKSFWCLKLLHNICPGGNPLQNISASLLYDGCERIIGVLLRCRPGVFHYISFSVPV